MPPDFIYLARGRPQRPRANLIQTLHTVEALTMAGARARLYVPPVPRSFDMANFLARMGIRHPIDIRPATSLHRRWGDRAFVWLHRRALLAARTVYTRVPEFSLALAQARIPHYLEIHDVDTLAKRGLLARLLDATHNRPLRALIAISEAGRQALIGAGFDPARVHVLHSGVDLNAFSAVTSPSVDAFAAPTAIYVGRVSHDRGLPLFEAMAAAGYPVTVIGPRDDEPAHAHPKLHLVDAIPHAEVPARLAEGAVALMPYQPDLRHAATISPIKLFEAMAAGRLVIASDLPALREVVRDGENGLLVPPDDPEAWIAAMAWVSDHPDAALRMAEAGRLTANDFGWDARAKRLLEFVNA